MYISKSIYLVAGLQKSGFSATKLLLQKKAKVYIYDKRLNDKITENKNQLVELGAIYVEDYKTIANEIDVLVISPGVPIDSDICKFYKSLNIRIIGELELSSLLTATPIIAVSGTNGKTTVCSLLHNALIQNECKSLLAGNVGTPLSEVIDKANESDVLVLEVSSYQLESTYSFCPHVSIILNITPDHLERHYSMENYTLVKSKLVLPLRESEYAVLNYDDEIVRNFSSLTRAKIIWFSKNEKVNGSYLKDGALYFNEEKIVEVSSLSLKEPHNLQNVLATICALKAIKLTNLQIKNSICNFKGVKHRFENVATVSGVQFINDSKSTNQDSTIKAIESLKKKTVLILGGSDKGLDYTKLFEKINKSNKIIKTVITGACANVMLSYAIKSNVDNIVMVKSFDDAVITAYRLCKEGEAVLLSPGTASFDEFSSFEKRGERFCEIVKSLK